MIENGTLPHTPSEEMKPSESRGDKSMKKLHPVDVVFSAPLLAVCYVAAIFLGNLIGYRSDLLMLVYLLCTAAVYGLMMLSRNTLTALCKWLLSLPLAYLCFQYFWETKFALRALNWMIPGYGRQSAGGNFAGLGQLLLLTLLCFAAWLAGLCYQPKNMQKVLRLQRMLGGIWLVGTVAAALWLERQFPPYEAVIAAV